VQANPAATALPPPGHLDAYRTQPGLYLALGQGAMPDDGLAAWGIVAGRLLRSQHGHFSRDRLRQKALRTLA
jgi:hypothetical protein